MILSKWMVLNTIHTLIQTEICTEFAVEDLPLGRTATLVPEFAVEDLPLDRTATLVPEFAVEDLPSAELQPWFLHLQ